MSAVGALHARGPSLAGLAFCIAAEAATLAVIFGPGQDPLHIRWPLVGLPLALAALPVVVPNRAARTGAAVVMTGWCVLASASIGFLFLPALLAMLVAATRSSGGRA